MIDVEALAVEAGISGVLHREEVARLVCMALEEAARVAESIGTDASQRKVAAAEIRALKPS
jgi:hypothetical protein